MEHYDNSQTISEIRLNMRLTALDRTIQYARVRCLAPDELINRIATLQGEDSADAYVHRLSELELSDSERMYLVDAMTHLAQRSENAPSILRAKLDRTLLRLVRLLPSESANIFAEPFVDHRLKSRRQWAYSALREKRVS
ncbi:MAG: hypothetical protein ACE5Q6_26630, partial [Dehalococcoidia bacterium]